MMVVECNFRLLYLYSSSLTLIRYVSVQDFTDLTSLNTFDDIDN